MLREKRAAAKRWRCGTNDMRVGRQHSVRKDETSCPWLSKLESLLITDILDDPRSYAEHN